MNPNWPKANVTLGPKDNSLERVRDKINAAGIGVIASVVSDATGSRLVLRATSTGEDNAFKVSAEAESGVDKDTANALSAMGFDPSKVSGDSAKLIQPAQDAKVEIDGRKLRSSQNLVDDEGSGLSLRVMGRSDAPVTINVSPDTDAIRSDIQAFAVTYNELSRQLSAIPAGTDDETIQTARSIQSRVQKAFSEQATKGGPASERLSAAGIDMDASGLIEVDSAKLTRALREQPAQVEKLLAASGEDNAFRGLARSLDDIRLSEGPQSPPEQGLAGPTPDEPATAAGTLFRQKLLEQYAPAEASDTAESGRNEEELAIQANEA
jgi:flagellar hook-associated protein 2